MNEQIRQTRRVAMENIYIFQNGMEELDGKILLV